MPRVDFNRNATFFYYRYRREKGGYISAAKKVIADSNYKSDNSWGDNEIHDAATGAPNGLSPAHWVAVRINMYITKQYIRLKKYSRISL